MAMSPEGFPDVESVLVTMMVVESVWASSGVLLVRSAWEPPR